MNSACSFQDCERKVYARGWCSSHYQQWRKGVPMLPIKLVKPRNQAYAGIRRNDPNKFWLLAKEIGECLVWQGNFYPNGYGNFKQNKVSHLAHRHAYSLAVGDIPDGMLIDHTCHNKACVKPSHLRLATVKQNQENLGGLKSNNTSGYRGVSRDYSRWRAVITHKKTFYHIGTYDTPEEAAEAVRLKRVELFTHNDLDRVA